jgi:DNA-binding response OmpR family regulator
MPVKVLVVDDDDAIRSLVDRYLKANGYAVVTASCARDGMALASDSKPDLILLDAELPDGKGHDFCRALSSKGGRTTPVIMMSGTYIKDNDVLSGLSNGADDYVTKPFSMAILQARIEAVMRRYRAAQETSPKQRKTGLELDAAGRTVSVSGKRLALTRKEFDLLAALLERSGRVLSIPFLLETVWGYDPADYCDPATVEVHVSHLRKKLGKLGKTIVNVPGHGYKFDDEAA